MKITVFSNLICVMLVACSPPVAETETTFEDLSLRDKPLAITEEPWHEIVVGVPDLSDVQLLFQRIGSFTTRYSDETSIVLGALGVDTGLIRFELTESDAIPTRPYGSRSWDTGCYFSIMMRAKNIPSIIEDADELGWKPLTEMAYLEFGPSKLNIVVLGHEKTGVQIQLYERLTTPLPEGFPEFDRLSRPFNMMQMVRDRYVAYSFYQQGLGFETFYFGKPYLSKEPVIMPLGIPPELTTTIPYKAGIVSPKSGLEWGRMEMIEVQMDGGEDLADRCSPGNIGITSVNFAVEDLTALRKDLRARKVDITKSSSKSLWVKTPDGANIEFSQK